MKTLLVLLLIMFTAASLLAQSPATSPATTQAAAIAGPGIPPAPTRHMNDYAGAITPERARQIDRVLSAHETRTSDQIVVAVYRKMNSDEPIETYTKRVANAWGVGQRDANNGVVLFVFLDDRQLYMQVGRGLETRLTNAVAKQIIETSIIPKFRTGDVAGGLEAGVQAIIASISSPQAK